MCSFQCSASFMCLFLSASSRAASVSFQVGCDWYRPGRIGIKSLMGRPNTYWAGESLVLESGYCDVAELHAEVSLCLLFSGSVVPTLRFTSSCFVMWY